MRESLLRRADQLAAVPLALVVAPAGSGKSTLLDAWRRRLADAGECSAYLDLSPLHANAAVLAADALEVARDVDPSFGADTALALADRSEAGESWRHLVRTWLRDATRLAAPLRLFLDNFHELPPDSDGARWIDEVIRARHPLLALVVASRGGTPPIGARLRTEGALLEITSADLSLRTDEVQQILALHGAGDDASLAARVLARTEGWATGVQLAARRLAAIEPAEREDFLRKLGREPDLFGFIAMEVLRDEPPEGVAILDAVALLGRCAPADVAELLGDPAAEQAVLRAAERGVLLSDGREVWVHQLWRDFVAERVAPPRTPDERRDLLRNAGTLLRRARRFESALECFAEAQDWGPLARILMENAEGWSREGRAERVRHWIARIPAEIVDRTAALLALRGVATVRPAPQHALPDLERAMEMYHQRGDRAQERALAGVVGVLYVSQLRRDDALRVLRRMITLRGVLTDPAERGGLYAALAQRRFLVGRRRGAFAMAQRAATMPLEPMTDWFNVMLLAWLQSARGEWEVALREIDRVLARPIVATYPFLQHAGRMLRARIQVMGGASDEALADAERAEEAFRDHRMPLIREMAGLVIGYAKSRLGRRDEARRWYEEVLRRASERGNGADAPARTQLALDLLTWGEAAEAAREARRALEAFDRAGDRWAMVMPWLDVYALWALACSGDATEAQAIARDRARRREMPELPLTHVTAQLALADVAKRAGDASGASQRARAAFEFAAREGVRKTEPMVGAHVVPTWAEWAVREGVTPDYAIDRLADIAPDRVAPLLAELAGHARAEVRERAVRLLARVGGRGAFEPLRAAADDATPRVRDAARAALDALDLRPSFLLRIRSLGALAASRGAEPVSPEAWKGQTARRLFARLLVAEGRALSREQIREDLWPDAEPDAGRNNLRVAVTRLNDALDPARPSGAAPHFVASEGDTLRLALDAIEDWDVARFRALLRDAEGSDDAKALAAMREALALYEGPLLPEIDDAWAQPLRRELADRFAAAAQRVGPRLVLRGRLDEATALAERMLRADPADEHAFALRMRVQLARRDRAGALRSYDEAVAVLRRELELEPGAELRQLAAQARSAE